MLRLKFTTIPSSLRELTRHNSARTAQVVSWFSGKRIASNIWCIYIYIVEYILLYSGIVYYFMWFYIYIVAIILSLSVISVLLRCLLPVQC